MAREEACGTGLLRLPSRLAPSHIVLRPHSFRVGRRDQPDFAVENANQVVEVLGAVRVAGCFQQFLA